MMDIENPWLLHFTHVQNLPGIIAQGLLAGSREPDISIDCGEPDIKQRRRHRDVPIEPFGVVADYVPFYFAARSPMLRRIHGGGVRGYEHGQEPLVYLVTRLSRVISLGTPWVATDRNAALATARYTSAAMDIPTHID
ncbi:uncharacterized protein DUF4433 [Allonocardiopsis opalescens]|uniref:Uncharacterized protein DUF4433 n=1 Tax=Allonocardiopsis opalescens TaxID=1144618 RepID=A0A2T0QCK6_9ACTN|nr:uncharacterized protein DUF4433 [Allonocardiopsis opalescens]